MSVFIIAEAASTHEGSLERAKRLIDLAYAVGCDAVKFQYCSSYPALAKKRGTEIKYPFSIPKESLPYLLGYCGDRIEFMCSCYLSEDISVVEPFVKRFKISNFESSDQNFINAHLRFGKPALVSGRNMYCVSLYPCPDEKAHLRNIVDTFSGYSDHTKNPLSGVLAVACGAEYVEFHLKLNDTTEQCPDFSVARTPEEAHTYVKNIRSAEILLG